MNLTKQAALRNLKRRYGTPGDPLYMAGIQRIKDHYKRALSTQEIKNFLAKSRAYTIHYDFKPVIHNPYYIRRLRQMIQIDLIEVSQIRENKNGFNYILVAIDCFSRKVWARLLKKKKADELRKQILKLKALLGLGDKGGDQGYNMMAVVNKDTPSKDISFGDTEETDDSLKLSKESGSEDKSGSLSCLLYTSPSPRDS